MPVYFKYYMLLYYHWLIVNKNNLNWYSINNFRTTKFTEFTFEIFLLRNNINMLIFIYSSEI